jgi:drug/metabolite transporter (DMT)-like permease
LTEPSPEGARWRALAALLAGACVIGLSPIFVRLTQTGPAAAGFWRLAFALPGLLWMLQRGGGLAPPSRLAIAAGIFFTLDLGFWHYGVKFTTVANATVLSNLTPVLVTAAAWILFRERPRRLFLAAVAVALAGAWLIALGHARGAGRAGLDPPLGDGLSALTAIWYAGYMLTIAAGRRRERAAVLMFWSSALGAPILLLAAVLLGERLIPLDAAGWAACVGLGLVHLCGQGALAWAMGRLPTSTASVVVLVQPVVAGALGYLLFAEAMSPLQLFGAGLALSGVILAQWASRPRPVAG